MEGNFSVERFYSMALTKTENEPIMGLLENHCGVYAIRDEETQYCPEIDVNTLCRNTGIKDSYEKYIFEYDLVKCRRFGENDCYGYIVFDDMRKCYVVRKFFEYGGATEINKYSLQVVGNVALSNDDRKIIEQQDEQEKRREISIDNSYCPSKFKR